MQMSKHLWIPDWVIASECIPFDWYDWVWQFRSSFLVQTEVKTWIMLCKLGMTSAPASSKVWYKGIYFKNLSNTKLSSIKKTLLSDRLLFHIACLKTWWSEKVERKTRSVVIRYHQSILLTSLYQFLCLFVYTPVDWHRSIKCAFCSFRLKLQQLIFYPR